MTDFPSGHRIDPCWLDRELYHAHIAVRPRFQDLDPLNHINNVAMAAMFEDARVRFNHPMRDHFQTDTVRTMVAGQTLNYVKECHMRPDLDFHIGIGRIGTSSWVTQACAWQGDTPVLLAVATLVATRSGRACAIPETLRDMLAERRMKPLS
ncbi:thioesterase family protein [uncultured Algimonas sp.]|uniref:acyl-CoA thioesterase n=1 Tax=uncultured Algimonas sp. TaxID=1547920 RepID=UPI00262AC898|nr:thioesterase family protein [uncultured Algimonas sp.]